MGSLANANRTKVIDVFTERLAFERAGVKLYDRIIDKMRFSGDPEILRMLEQMQEHRDQEKEHEEWLEAQIRALGGDAHGQTSKSRLAETESSGIEKIILQDEAEIPEMFHALMVAELADNAGWDLLVQLADEADDSELKKAFKKRLHHEEEHLLFVRRALQKFAFREVLSQAASMPTFP